MHPSRKAPVRAPSTPSIASADNDDDSWLLAESPVKKVKTKSPSDGDRLWINRCINPQSIPHERTGVLTAWIRDVLLCAAAVSHACSQQLEQLLAYLLGAGQGLTPNTVLPHSLRL